MRDKKTARCTPLFMYSRKPAKHWDGPTMRLAPLCVGLIGFLALFSVAMAAVQVVEAAPFAYIANHGGASVSVIDTCTNTVIANIAVGSGPSGVAVHPHGTRVYVTNQNSDTLSVIDTATHTVVATVAVADNPSGVAVHPDGSRVYVGRHGGPVEVVSTSTNSVIGTISPGGRGLAIQPTGTFLYATDANDGRRLLHVINTSTNSEVATVGVGNNPAQVAVHPAGTHVYVTNQDSHDVSVVAAATDTEVVRIPVGQEPGAIAVHPGGTFLYVANYLSDNVSVINATTNSVVATILVGNAPSGVGVRPDGTRAYVTKEGDNAVSVIDTATNTVVGDPIAVGARPVAGGGLFITPGACTIIKTVPIDIKPGSLPNSINLSAAGVVPVAILSSATFDAMQVNPATVTLAGAKVKLIGKGDKYSCSAEDVNGDGRLDLVCHVVTAQFLIEPGDSIAVLEAETFGGTSIRGEDSIQIVPD